MSGKVFFVLFSFLLIISFKSYSPGPVPIQRILTTYARADRLYNTSNSSSATDSASMRGFEEVMEALAVLPRERMTDSLMFQAGSRLGILYEVHKDFPKATGAYLQALNFAVNAGEKFSMQVFAGTGYYNQNNFDSASYFLLRAADSASELGSSEDRVRLFNTLGVLYYDNGNFLQSKNYFSQSLRLIETNHLAEDLVVYTQMNMASCYYKMGMFEPALVIYRKILLHQWFPNPVYMNLGKTYAGLHKYEEALASFKKVKSSLTPGVLNEMAKTALEAGNADSAEAWLSKYRDKKKSGRVNILDDGINELYSGDLDIFRDDPSSALRHLQEALIIFSGNFTEKDIRRNPVRFTGSFAYYRLFEVLDKKAFACEMLFRKSKRPEDLLTAYDTYQAAISLLSYIERSYEMDDAKLLLKQKSGQIYTRAMTVSLQLSGFYPEKKFLEQAFLISEKNKASVMGSQIRERNFLLSSGSENVLAGQERNIKFNIARLNTKADEGLDTKALQQINDQKSVYETELVNLRRKMEGNRKFYQLKYSDDFPSIAELQKSIGSDQTLISFNNTPEKIEVFVLDRDSLLHIQLDSGQAIRHQIQLWIGTLQNAENGRHTNSKALKRYLFEHLMKPIIALAGNKEEWIVIPDGLFFLLPLESLPENQDGRMVLDDHLISYEFSSRFIMENNRPSPDPGVESPVLSFAPFSLSGIEINKEGTGWLEKLPFSKDEIGGLPGSRYLDKQATKPVFIKNLNRFPVIHLATHAITDIKNPSASFIAFYPSAENRSEDFLFLDEIYSLSLDSCQMIVISACETGRGELVSNEGVMSFARAFLYAGCPSTINTLWKADDRSTAEIFRLFYKYLEAGDSKSRSLQKAKLEFIRNNPISRDPAYWSHIVLTGNPAALYKKKQPWIWAALGISFGTILFYLVRKRKEKKVDAFHS